MPTEARRAYLDRTREHRLSLAKAYREANKERIQQRRREFKAVTAQYDKLYRAKNKEKIAARKKLAESTEEYKARKRALRVPAKRREQWAQWVKLNPDKRKSCRAASKARRRGACVKERSATLVTRLRALQKNRCAACHKSVAACTHLDHVVPIAKGGTHEFHNLQLLCPPCNLAKAAKHPIAFAQSMGRLL